MSAIDFVAEWGDSSDLAGGKIFLYFSQIIRGVNENERD